MSMSGSSADLTEARDNDALVELGNKLRVRRKELRMTLQAVAGAAGLTPGFISQLERGLAAPSLSSLSAIARVLRLDTAGFIVQPQPDELTRSESRQRYGVHQDALFYERISSSFPGSIIRTVIIHEPPGYRGEPIQHEGEELFYVLSGALTVEIEGVRHLLNTGDSIHFPSNRVHSSWNHTNDSTAILHTCTMDVFGDTGPGHLHVQSIPANKLKNRENQ